MKVYRRTEIFWTNERIRVFRESFEKYHDRTFSYFIRGGSESFSKKRGWRSSGKISKSTMVLFCSIIPSGDGWVVNFKNFEKLAYDPSKKYLHPLSWFKFGQFRNEFGKPGKNQKGCLAIWGLVFQFFDIPRAWYGFKLYKIGLGLLVFFCPFWQIYYCLLNFVPCSLPPWIGINYKKSVVGPFLCFVHFVCNSPTNKELQQR